jgi:hypothetical protein
MVNDTEKQSRTLYIFGRPFSASEKVPSVKNSRRSPKCLALGTFDILHVHHHRRTTEKGGNTDSTSLHRHRNAARAGAGSGTRGAGATCTAARRGGRRDRRGWSRNAAREWDSGCLAGAREGGRLRASSDVGRSIGVRGIEHARFMSVPFRRVRRREEMLTCQ